MKEKVTLKIFFIFIIVTIGLLVSLFIFLINYFFDDKDACLDTSICKEGLEVNTEYGLIKVNKDNCLKYNWIWDDELRYCNMRNDNNK